MEAENPTGSADASRTRQTCTRGRARIHPLATLAVILSIREEDVRIATIRMHFSCDSLFFFLKWPACQRKGCQEVGKWTDDISCEGDGRQKGEIRFSSLISLGVSSVLTHGLYIFSVCIFTLLQLLPSTSYLFSLSLFWSVSASLSPQRANSRF